MSSAPAWLHLPSPTSGTTAAPAAPAHGSLCSRTLLSSGASSRFQHLIVPGETLSKARIKGKIPNHSRRDQLDPLTGILSEVREEHGCFKSDFNPVRGKRAVRKDFNASAAWKRDSRAG